MTYLLGDPGGREFHRCKTKAHRTSLRLLRPASTETTSRGRASGMKPGREKTAPSGPAHN